MTFMKGKNPKEEFSEQEIARRRDEALLRALNTPPKRHSEMKLGRTKPKARGSRQKAQRKDDE
jgi:hypothetical protein